MALSSRAVRELVHDRLYQPWKTERARLDKLDAWYRFDPESVPIPNGATRELRQLIDLARTPWLRLVVSTTAQAMYVDGYRSPESSENATAWDAWQRNDFDARQIAIHRYAIAFGYCFATVLPGDKGAVLRGISPRKMQAFYTDPGEDDWPRLAIRVDGQGAPGRKLIRVYDEEAEYILSTESDGDQIEYLDTKVHDFGECPVVRYAVGLDLDARTDGEIEPFIPIAQRINKTVYDRLMTQHYNSWKVRTVAGMAEPLVPGTDETDVEAAAQTKLNLRQDDLLVAEDPDTKFGTLPETPLDGFIRAGESDVKTLAAVSQTPAHSLTGDLINLNAEALEAARADYTNKITEMRTVIGKSHDQLLRAAAFVDGDTTGAEDFAAHVTWQDTTIRSLSQAVDALGKAAQMLNVPVQALWQRIPGVTKLDVDEWRRMAAELSETDSVARLANALTAQAEQPSASFAPAPAPAPNGATPPPAG